MPFNTNVSGTLLLMLLTRLSFIYPSVQFTLDCDVSDQQTLTVQWMPADSRPDSILQRTDRCVETWEPSLTQVCTHSPLFLTLILLDLSVTQFTSISLSLYSSVCHHLRLCPVILILVVTTSLVLVVRP